jgi:ubiquinone/menaquinone biosynthesis C-methylase UbiE
MAFDELKAQQGRMWSNGNFEKLADTIADVHDAVVQRLEPKAGERWLDIACGTGGVAERAARAGADVTGIDLAPAQIETARRRAGELGLAIDYEVGDAEKLESVAAGSFDVASSSFGLIFAPNHEAAASELARVVRPGGRIGLANWTEGGGIRDFFRLMAPFQPPPPEGAGNPFAWGDEQHVTELLGAAFELRFERLVSTLTASDSEDMWRLMVENCGPTKTLYESLPPQRREEFHRVWVDFFEERYRRGDEIVQDREYVLVLGTRR